MNTMEELESLAVLEKQF